MNESQLCLSIDEALHFIVDMANLYVLKANTTKKASTVLFFRNVTLWPSICFSFIGWQSQLRSI